MSEIKLNETGSILLDAVLESGAEIPYGCRTAKCGVCSVEIVSGQLAAPGELEAATLTAFKCEPGIRLACQAHTQGEVVVRAVEK